MATKEKSVTALKPSPAEMRNAQEALEIVYATHKEHGLSRRQVWQMLKAPVLTVLCGYTEEGTNSRLSWHAARNAIAMWRQVSMAPKSTGVLSMEQLWNIGCILEGVFESSGGEEAPPAPKPEVKKRRAPAKKAPAKKRRAAPKSNPLAAAEAKLKALGGSK